MSSNGPIEHKIRGVATIYARAYLKSLIYIYIYIYIYILFFSLFDLFIYLQIFCILRGPNFSRNSRPWRSQVTPLPQVFSLSTYSKKKILFLKGLVQKYFLSDKPGTAAKNKEKILHLIRVTRIVKFKVKRHSKYN